MTAPGPGPGARGLPPRGEALELFLVHGERLLTEVVTRSFRQRDDLRLVGACGDVEEAAAALRERPRTVVLVDASRYRREALEAVRELGDRLPVLEILPFGLETAEEVVEFVEAGASGYVLSCQSFGELVETARSLHRGRTTCDREVARRVLARIVNLAGESRPPSPPPETDLTPREHEVLLLVAEGLANKEIAAELGIAPSTVKNHVHKLLGKLGVPRRREAVRVAYEHGLIADCLPWRSPRG